MVVSISPPLTNIFHPFNTNSTKAPPMNFQEFNTTKHTSGSSEFVDVTIIRYNWNMFWEWIAIFFTNKYWEVQRIENPHKVECRNLVAVAVVNFASWGWKKFRKQHLSKCRLWFPSQPPKNSGDWITIHFIKFSEPFCLSVPRSCHNEHL